MNLSKEAIIQNRDFKRLTLISEGAKNFESGDEVFVSTYLIEKKEFGGKLINLVRMLPKWKDKRTGSEVHLLSRMKKRFHVDQTYTPTGELLEYEVKRTIIDRGNYWLILLEEKYSFDV